MIFRMITNRTSSSRSLKTRKKSRTMKKQKVTVTHHRFNPKMKTRQSKKLDNNWFQIFSNPKMKDRQNWSKQKTIGTMNKTQIRNYKKTPIRFHLMSIKMKKKTTINKLIQELASIKKYRMMIKGRSRVEKRTTISSKKMNKLKTKARLIYQKPPQFQPTYIQTLNN